MDPIADMLTRIKNAGAAGKETLSVPHSKFKASILEALKRRGYIKSYTGSGKGVKSSIEIELAYEQGAPRIAYLARVSKPSRRTYMEVRDIKPVRYGRGSLVLSTPKGVLTDDEARREKVGGEALFKIW